MERSLKGARSSERLQRKGQQEQKWKQQQPPPWRHQLWTTTTQMMQVAKKHDKDNNNIKNLTPAPLGHGILCWLVVFKLQRSDDFNFQISGADRSGGLKTPEMGSLVSTDTMYQSSITVSACLYLGHLKSWIAALCGYVQTQFDEMAVEQFWYILTHWTALLRQNNGH